MNNRRDSDNSNNNNDNDNENENDLSGSMITPINGSEPNMLICVLHGYGSSGEDMEYIGNVFADRFPDALVSMPNAPFEYENAMSGYQWFSLEDRSDSAIYGGVDHVYTRIIEHIQKMQHIYGISNKQTVLAGFSQGGMLTMHTILRMHEPILCGISFSGMLISPHRVGSEMTSKAPIAVIHGDADDVVPVVCADKTYETLRANDIKTYKHIVPQLGHSINTQALQMAIGFVEEALGF